MKTIEININKSLLAFIAGLTSLTGLLLTLPKMFYIFLYSLPLQVRLGVSVIYSVLTFVLIYLIIRK